MWAGVFWGSRDGWIWKQWQTPWYGLHRLQRGRKLEQKDLVKESSSRAGPPLYGIKDERTKKKRKHKHVFRRQRDSQQGAIRGGNRPREAIERLMAVPFGKRNCVCQNRWQLVKKIRRCYYCFQRHFRLINPPNTDKHTLPSQNINCFVSSHPASAWPSVTHLVFFSKQQQQQQLESGRVLMLYVTIEILHSIPNNCGLLTVFFMSVFVWEFIDVMLNLRTTWTFLP